MDETIRSAPWYALYGHTCRRIRQILVPFNELPDDVPAWVSTTTAQENDVADKAILDLINDRAWPTLDARTRLMILLRLLYAAEYFLARHLAGREPPPAELTGKVFLLVTTDGWYRDWRSWTKVHFGENWNLPFDPWDPKAGPGWESRN